PYRLASLLVNLIAYADDPTLVAASGEGMEEAMKKMNDFCTHNNITINENKSSYHWLRGEPGDIKTRGTDIRKEGADGLFTILGWTTNLKMNWDEQIELLIQRFMSITNRALAEKKLTLNQKVEVINAIGLSTISYRAQHTMTDKGEWLIELDRWTMKKLNKLGGLDPHTDKAYWINFRGYRSLYSEATATYFGYSLDKTMNNPAVNINIRTAKAIEVEMTAKRFGLTLRANRTDTIDRVSTDTKTEKALKRYGVLYIEQLIRGDRIELLIQRFMSITNRALAEKKLTLNQKVEVINAIGLSTISYRAQHTMTDKGEWLIELDRWTIKKLNKLGGLDPHTDKAYVINFRGYHSLYSKATATYFGYLLDKTMNNPAVNINIRTAKAIEIEMTAKRFGLTLRANRTDTIAEVITTNETDKINMDAPADSKKYNKWTFQLQKAEHKRSITQNCVESYVQSHTQRAQNIWRYVQMGEHKRSITQNCVESSVQLHRQVQPTISQYIQTASIASFSAPRESQQSSSMLDHMPMIIDDMITKKEENRTNKDSLIRGDRVITTNETDKINMDAPADSKKYNKWTFQLQKAEHKRSITQNCVESYVQSHTQRYKEIEKGNKEADRLASIAYIRENITSTPDYTLETGGRLITENTREHIRRMMNNLSTEDWRDRQKVWLAFFTCQADPRSLPKKKEPYSNLITKIMTGTIWTNKRKKQYNLRG
ncbi:hypothetical protein PROFUN_14735, partial [Planoprotostelium fungivorum]